MTVNPGNSGGPLCRQRTAELVGVVNEQVIDQDAVPTGIGCAVALNIVKPVVERMTAMSADELLDRITQRIDGNDGGELF